MTTNPKGYEKQRRIEILATAAFLATDGEVTSAVSGKEMKFCYGLHKDDECLTFHHVIPLNGRRPNGSNAKAAEILANYWNIEIMTIREHREFHYNNGT